MYGISCTAPSQCTAVGGDTAGPIVATETAGAWGNATHVAAPSVSHFNSVSCTDSLSCTAVGRDENSGNAIYATETGGVWGNATEIITLGRYTNLESVSCTAPGDCTAVGLDGNANPVHGWPIVTTETGGVWSSVAEVSPPGGGSSVWGFSGVSCTGPGNCTAVGDDGLQPDPIYATESAGVWSPASVVPLTPGRGGGQFRAINCQGPGDCTAVGQDVNINLGPVSVGIYAVLSGGVWGPVTELSTGGLDELSCTDSTDCTAIGGKRVNLLLPLAITESSGVWGTPTSMAASQASFHDVSCPVAEECTAVGDTDGPTFLPIYSTSMVAAAPTVTKFTPTSGPAGTVVTITGTGLSRATRVTFNGVKGTIASDTPTKLKVIVPVGATTGKIKVVTPGGTVKTVTAFKVT